MKSGPVLLKIRPLSFYFKMAIYGGCDFVSLDLNEKC